MEEEGGRGLHGSGEHGEEVARDVRRLRDEDLEGHAERIERHCDVARCAEREHHRQELAKVPDGAEDGVEQPADVAVGVAFIPCWNCRRSYRE